MNGVLLWLEAKVDQRLAALEDGLKGYPLEGVGVVMTPLTEPPEDASLADLDRWERACDNCGKYCPTTFYTGNTTRLLNGVKVVVTFGACPRCAGKERA